MQVGQDKGSCSFQRNHSPCVVPQENENIFHTIFAFFMKSGRKVLVRNVPLMGPLERTEYFINILHGLA